MPIKRQTMVYELVTRRLLRIERSNNESEPMEVDEVLADKGADETEKAVVIEEEAENEKDEEAKDEEESEIEDYSDSESSSDYGSSSSDYTEDEDEEDEDPDDGGETITTPELPETPATTTESK